MRNWDEAVVWEGGGLRREAFYVRSDGCDVFASAYAPAQPSRGLVLVVCPGWGHHGAASTGLQHGLALGMARLGGTGVAFDYPGQGDSGGEPESATLGVLSRSVVDVYEGTHKRWAGEPVLAGIRLGACVAALATEALHPAAVLLVEGDLDPEAYFTAELRSSRRANLQNPEAQGLAYGVPVSPDVLSSTRDVGGVVRTLISNLTCPVASIRYSRTGSRRATSDGITEIGIEGTWSTAQRQHAPLLEAALRWLDEDLGRSA